MPSRLKTITAALALLSASLPTLASDAATDAMQAAYAPYRAALFKTNSKSQTDAQQAMDAARSAWQIVITRFADKPPAPYDRDPAFGRTLGEVAAVYARADAQVRAQQLAQAHETLEAARDLMAALRQRNGVVVFSDHMNAYHSEMEHALEGIDESLKSPQPAMQWMARAGVLDYLARRLLREAPAELASNAEFVQMHGALLDSVAALRKAALAQDVDAIRQAAGRLKAPYSRLFLKFG